MKESTQGRGLGQPTADALAALATGRRTQSARRRPLSRKKKALFSAIVFLLTAVLVYAGTIVYRSARLYLAVIDQPRGWEGRIHSYDPEFGVVPTRDIRGVFDSPPGRQIPVCHDKDGFRVVVGSPDAGERGRPLILALGCSFTYGEGCRAEHTYVHLVAEALGGTALNAAGCSWGLCQMLLRARTDIPRYRPDYVLVQFSPWLIERALEVYSYTYQGLVPVPYFSAGPGGAPVLQPPIGPSRLFDLPIGDYRGRRWELGNFISFVARVGLPLCWHDDRMKARYQFKRLSGGQPKPGGDAERIVEAVYGEIADLCRKNGSRMVVVVLGMDAEELPIPACLRRMEVEEVNAYAAMVGRLPQKDSETFRLAYNHLDGPYVVDLHPDERAHRFIAEEIVRALRSGGQR